jgi:hypothetical protein
MNHKIVSLIVLLFVLGPPTSTRAQQPDITLPAGMLLYCTVSEPNFSPATAEIGDPVVCDVDAVQRFGRTLPRGTYLVGHLTDAHQPGRFVGKGSMTLTFDRIGLPNTELPLPSKIIAASKEHIDRTGRIIGAGHAKRDAIEWAIPILWPWKVLTLPARGPEPAMKGEVRITVRLMESLLPPSQPIAPQAALNSSKPLVAPSPQVAMAIYKPGNSHMRSAEFTLLVVKPSSVYVVSDYWLADDLRLEYVLLTGTQQTIDLSQLDWDMTTKLNADRGVKVMLRDDGPHPY